MHVEDIDGPPAIVWYIGGGGLRGHRAGSGAGTPFQAFSDP